MQVLHIGTEGTEDTIGTASFTHATGTAAI